MITIKSNIKDVAGLVKSKLDLLSNKEYLLRPLCVDLVAVMPKRIHIQGQASDGTKIGTYSSAYLKYRQKKFKRSGDRKTIISLSRQLENDWSVIPTTKGYGVGFKNSHNFDKSRWVEEIYGKKIFFMTSSEQQMVTDGISDLVQKALK